MGAAMSNRLITIRLHGPLATQYGAEHRFAVSSPREVVSALDANFPGFRRDFLAGGHYGLLVDGDWRDETNCPDVANAPISREIDICPIIEGRLHIPITAAVAAVIGQGVAANIIGSVLTLALLTGASLLLSPKVKKPTGKDGNKNENYIFSGPENVTEQGPPVPLVYGRCFVGSVVVSAGLEVSENLGTTSANNWVWNRPT
jgi:predicted phage tail protein